jgi:hypothetical protein
VHQGGLLAVYKGNPPAIAVEFARRVLPHESGRRSTRPKSSAAARPRTSRGGRGVSTTTDVIIIKKQATASTRPSWRRLEGGLRRLRDGDDGVLPGDVAGRAEHRR